MHHDFRGGPKGELDVRVTDLPLTLITLPALPTVRPAAPEAAPPAAPAAAPAEPTSKPWLMAAAIVAAFLMLVLAVAVAAGLYLRKPRPPQRAEPRKRPGK